MNRNITPYVLKRSPDHGTASALSIDYAAALNSQQLAAVTAGEGPSLVIAGAGSGKTRTLVYRVAYLIDSGIDPFRILLLTFTRNRRRKCSNGSVTHRRTQRTCPSWHIPLSG